MKNNNFIGIAGGVKLDVTKLRTIERELGKQFIVKIGILGGEASKPHDKSKTTNSEIGIAHEYGVKTKNLPQRSFLRMPLYTKLPSVIGKLGQKVIDGLTTENIDAAYKFLGIMAERIVQGAFATDGYGKWEKLSEKTIKRKKSQAILIDTAQLRRSITSKVVEVA